MSDFDVIKSIEARYSALMANYEDGEFPDEESFMDTWESIDGEIDAKADAIAYVISKMEGENRLRDEEIERLMRKNEVATNAIERMKKMLWNMMEVCDKPKFKTPYHSFNIAKNGGLKPLVFVDGKANLDEIDDRFVKVKVDRDVDNKAIREALDNGEVLDFVYYGERGKRLDIR